MPVSATESSSSACSAAAAAAEAEVDASANAFAVRAVAHVCGRIRTTAEACDDGGIAAGDGCSANCTVEAGYDGRSRPDQPLRSAGGPDAVLCARQLRAVCRGLERRRLCAAWARTARP